MSATSHDAFPEFAGKLLKFDAPAAEVSDPTEDLAEEITSELAPTPRRTAPAVATEQRAEAQGAGLAVVRNAGERVLRERYVLESPLGNGGMATVYRARDLRRDASAGDGHRVAIKLLRPELGEQPHCIARLQREFRQTQAAAHPNVVRVLDLDCDQGTWFIVMEHLAGETLGPRLRRVTPGGLPAAEALGIGVAVGEALAHAHARGVTHGDVKPDNIFLTSAGDVRLLDFGVAPEPAVSPATGQDAAARVDAAATRVYASPEVLAGEVPEPRDDVFSFACVVHEMLAGSHPYGRRGADLALAQSTSPAPLEALDGERRMVLLAALDLRRSARPDMQTLVGALRGEVAAPAAVAISPEVGPAPDIVAGPARSWTGSSRLAIASAVAAVLALVLGILIGRQDAGPVTVTAPAAPAPRVEARAEPQEPLPAAEQTAQFRLPEPTAASEEPAPAVDGPPGLVSFDAPAMTVSAHAVVAAIPLRHLSRVRRAVDVRWRVIDGSARAGRDYGGPATGVESFIEGHSFRILYVPLFGTTGATPSRSFTVELTDASGGVDLGPTPRIEVTILGDF